MGFTTLNLPINQPLLPLLIGLFGTSSLIISVKEKTKIPKQETLSLKKLKPTKKDLFKANLGSIVSAPLVSFLPGIGAGQAAIIGSEIIKQSQKSFLILLGSINTIVMGLSFITFYVIGKTRTGSAVAISKIIEQITLSNLLLIIFTIILTSIISSFLTINLSKFLVKRIHKINYNDLSIFILIILTLLTLIFSGPIGAIILITSTALGIFTINSKIRRINLMGSLLVPTILFYIF